VQPEPVTPRQVRPGDLVRVVAPSLSRTVIDRALWPLIESRFAELGLRLSYGAHVDEDDGSGSAPVAHRVADLHDAFADPEVALVITVIGGYSSNELLPSLDWELVRSNPKAFCGYSDITALQAAMLARAGLVTFSGPHWSTFGMRDHLEQTVDWFRRQVLGHAEIPVGPSSGWTDDAWFADQDDRTVHPNAGWWPLQPGTAAGRVVGTNLCTLNLLQGTGFMPSLDGALLVLEDDDEGHPATFARDLTSLLQLPDADGVTGLVVGRFQRASGMTPDRLAAIVAGQPALAGKPVLADVDVGHTSPMATVPIGGRARIDVPEPGSTRRGSFTVAVR
jgi:muramoyltetrapeptide carboxypeptidase